MSSDDAIVPFRIEASDEQLKFLNPITMFEYEKIDASIGVWSEENTRAMTNADPKKLALSQASRKPLMKVFFNRAAEGR